MNMNYMTDTKNMLELDEYHLQLFLEWNDLLHTEEMLPWA